MGDKVSLDFCFAFTTDKKDNFWRNLKIIRDNGIFLSCSQLPFFAFCSAWFGHRTLLLQSHTIEILRANSIMKSKTND